MLENFRKVGRWLEERGLNTSHSGNLSVRVGDRMLITARGAMLGNLKVEDLIEVDLMGEGGWEKASTEAPVHREIYLRTDRRAVVHAHPPYAVVLSLLGFEKVVPMDVEGKHILGEVPVLELENPVGSSEAAEAIAEVLKEGRCAVVKGHGVFAGGESLLEAYHFITVLEFSSKVTYLTYLKEGLK